MTWFISNILLLSHGLVISCCSSRRCCRHDREPARRPDLAQRRRSHRATSRLQRHTPSSFSAGDTHLVSLGAPHVPRTPDEPDRTGASPTSRAHPTRLTSTTTPHAVDSPRTASVSAMAAASCKRRKDVAEHEHVLKHNGDIRLLPTSIARSYARLWSRRARRLQCAPITRTGRVRLAATAYCPAPLRRQLQRITSMPPCHCVRSEERRVGKECRN